MAPATLKSKVEALPDLRKRVLSHLNRSEDIIARKAREELYAALDMAIMLDRDIEFVARRSNDTHLDTQLKKCTNDCAGVYERLEERLNEIRETELQDSNPTRGLQAAKRAAAREEEGLLEEADKLRAVARTVRTLKSDADGY